MPQSTVSEQGLRGAGPLTSFDQEPPAELCEQGRHSLKQPSDSSDEGDEKDYGFGFHGWTSRLVALSTKRAC